MKKLLVLGAVCVLPVSIHAQTGSQLPAPTTAVAAPVSEEKPLCRTYGKTGSILPGKRVCHTKKEWHEIDTLNAQTARRTMGRDGPVAAEVPN